MSGKWHQSVELPGGTKVTADHREPVVEVMRRWITHGEPSDLAAITGWYQANVEAVAECQAGACDHYV